MQMATALLRIFICHLGSQLTRRVTCLLQTMAITRYARFHPRGWSPRWRGAAIKGTLTASAVRQPLHVQLAWQSTQQHSNSSST